MTIEQRNPEIASHWGPSVRFPRRHLTQNGQLKIGSTKNGHIVVAVKFSNQGTNSKVFIGNRDGEEEIPRTGAAEISFGTGWPHCIEDEFTVRFDAIGAGTVNHLCLITETVVNCVK
jgi:hypothetical protein